MNRRIKELAEQFRMDFSIDENSQDGIHWDNVDEFAELIVRECAEICLEANDHKNILHHFGIVE